MASVLSAIRAQMLADANDPASINAALEGPVAAPPQTRPYVLLVWGDEETEYQYFNARTVRQLLSIGVYGDKREHVDLAIEDLANLWDTGTCRTALQALGVIDVRCDIGSPSYTIDKGIHQGVIQFTVEYRVTIAAPA